MISTLRSMLLLAAAVFLAGCAGLEPRYQTLYRYEPPVLGAESRACLEKCEHKLAGCQQQCSTKYQACLGSIEPLVEKRHAEALQRYATELDTYGAALRHYQLNLSMTWGYDPFWFGPHYYYPWPGPYYIPPVPPRSPSHEEIAKQVREEKCEPECGCQSGYDACFLSCGGKKIPEVRCIANCPAEK